MGLNLDEDSGKTLFYSFSEELNDFSQDIGVRVPCIDGDFPSPVHFWEEERKHAESERRITGSLSCWFLASSSARHAAPNSALFEELPSSPLPSWQQPPLCSLSLKKPAPHDTPIIGAICGID